MNYQIIKDPEAFQEYIDFLPELKEGEVYYYALFGRNKYNKDLSGAKSSILKKGFTTKRFLYREVEQLQLPIGSLRRRGVEIPQDALAIYINPNPRCVNTMLLDLEIEVAKRRKNKASINVLELMTSIGPKAKSYTAFCHFDVDSKDTSPELLKEIVNPEAISVVETKGGYHFLIDPKKAGFSKNDPWVKRIKNTFEVDKVEDQACPVPGCVQGDFVPKLVCY